MEDKGEAGGMPYAKADAASPSAHVSDTGNIESSQSTSQASTSKKKGRQEHIHKKDAYPWDMESLKAALLSANPGTGEIHTLISKSQFCPRAPAFTALINLCGKEKLAQHAMDVFEASESVPGIEKNTYMYSALISALGACGMYDKALGVFEEMHEVAKVDTNCKPNTITYSAVISAFERAGELERAWQFYERMRTEKILPDLITYSVVLSACEKQGNADRALQIIEAMHRDGLQATPMNYSRLIGTLGDNGQVDLATEVFLQMQLAGCEINLNLCNVMINCLDKNLRGDLAYFFLRSMHNNGMVGETVTYNMVLSALLKTWRTEDPLHMMLEVYQMMKYFGVRVSTYTCKLLIEACERSKQANIALALTHEFQQLKIRLDEETLGNLNSLLRQENVDN